MHTDETPPRAAFVAYPSGLLVQTLGRGALAICVTGVPLAVFAPPAPIGPTLLVATALFALLTAVAVRRALVRFVATPEGVLALGPGLRRRVAWERLRGLRLRYLGQGSGGLQMELTLTDDRGRLTVLSALPSFAALAAAATLAAERRRVPLDEITLANLAALGHEVDVERREREPPLRLPTAGPPARVGRVGAPAP